MSARLISPEKIDEAVCCMRQGGVVAYPTETFYGLGVDPFFPGALEKIIAAKKRDAAKPVLVIIDQLSSLSGLVASVPSEVHVLVDAFWPGPLTLVLPAKNKVPHGVTGNTHTVGVRISSHPVAHALAHGYGGPITSTSANISGLQPLTTSGEVMDVLGDVVDMIVDGGPCPGGHGSTLVALDKGGIRLVREGVVPFHEVCQVLETKKA